MKRCPLCGSTLKEVDPEFSTLVLDYDCINCGYMEREETIPPERWMKLSDESMMNALEIYEMGKDFYTSTFARKAAVLALKSFLSTERDSMPRTRSVEELMQWSCMYEPRFCDVRESTELDWWPMPPRNIGEVVPPIVQAMCSSYETAEQSLDMASKVLNKVREILTPRLGWFNLPPECP